MSSLVARTAFALFLAPVGLHAQSYDPERGHPFSLLSVPKDGVAYFQMKQRVLKLAAENKPAEAEPLVEQLVREYPRDGENWFLLGRVKRRLNKAESAAAAFDSAGVYLGRRSPGRSLDLNAAAIRLAQGNKPAALDAIRRSIFDDHLIVRGTLIDEPSLAALRTDSTFLRLIGRRDTTGETRTEGWRRDVDLLVEEVKRVNPDYRETALPAEFVRRYESLEKNIPVLTREQFIVGINRMLAALRQGHTDIMDGGPYHYLPVEFYAFPEGIYIVNATDTYKKLLGARVVSFGRTPAEEALRLMNLMQSVDGDMEYLNQGPVMLRNVEFLKGSGIDINVDSIELAIEQGNGPSRTVWLRPSSLPGPALPPPPNVEPPLFLRHEGSARWVEPMSEHNALYVAVNRMRNDSLETLPAFGTRLWKILEDDKPLNLIIDLRLNGGGTTSLYPELLRTIIAFTRTGGRRLFVLIGRGTYSATGNFITDLERLANPIFVGEASSECCDLHGDAAAVTLPFSGQSGRVSGVRWNLTNDVFDDRREMSPQVPVQMTAKAYFAGEDPALAAIVRLIHAPADSTR